MSDPVALVVDDDLDLADTCAKLLSRSAVPALSASGGQEALDLCARHPSIRVVVADLKMPEMDGLQLLSRVKRRFPATAVIIMTGHGSIATAVEAMKVGAADYVTKPFDHRDLVDSVRRLTPSRSGTPRADARGAPPLIGDSDAIRELRRRISALADSSVSALIVGESGTGKEVVARNIHAHSARAPHPFVAINCASLPEQLVESELFGHRKGAFSGATTNSPGLLRAAEGGTVFLDELCEMPVALQPKLLRVIEDRTVRSVGSIKEIGVDVRFLAATNRDPQQALQQGQLRQDLFYRLSVVTINTPPLREHINDLEPLAAHYGQQAGLLTDASGSVIDEQALQQMRAYAWPGNVRELQNVVTAAALTGASRIGLQELPANVTAGGPSSAADPAPAETLTGSEQRAVQRAMEAAGGNKSEAARILGISRTRLYRKLRLMAELGISTDR